MRDSHLFDEAVKIFFAPFAQTLSLLLSKIRDGVYEIQSPYFIMRIRLHTGHRRGLNVLFRPASLRDFDENQPGGEYGIGNFALYHGQRIEEPIIETDADFLNVAENLGKAARQFGTPYLLGAGGDWEAIKEMASGRNEESIEEIKQYRFPKNVRKEWL